MATINSLNNASAPFGVTGNVTITNGNLALPTATSSGVYGVITSNASIVMHNYGTRNICLGVGSGGTLTFTAANVQDNVGIGYNALNNFQSGEDPLRNTAVGAYAMNLPYKTGCTSNVGIGYYAAGNLYGAGGAYNVAIGAYAMNTGWCDSYNIAIGYNAASGVGSRAYSNIYLNNIGGNESNKLRIGAASGTGNQELNDVWIYGTYTPTTAIGGTAKVMLVDSNDHIGGLAGSANTIFVGGTAPSFTATPQCTDLTLTGVLNLPTTSSTVGQIKINSVSFFHAYGNYNVFIGTNSGNFTLTVGSARYNVGIGEEALDALTSGEQNTGIGYRSGSAITSGICNTGIGMNSLRLLSTGNNNVAFGTGTLDGVSGSNNSAFGRQAFYQIGNASDNIGIGYNAGGSCTGTDSSNILIGNAGSAGLNNTTIIGTNGSGSGQQNACYIAGVYGVTPGGTLNVALVDSNHKFGSVASLAVGNGGTGTNTLTDHGVMLGSGTSAVTVTAVGATGEVFIGNTGADASWSSAPTVTTMYATTFDTNVAAAAVTLAGTTLAADGTDTDISITITPKGTGVLSTGNITSTAVYAKSVGATNRAMLVDDTGVIGNATSSIKFKENIRDMSSQSDCLMQLRPVVFNYKGDESKRDKFGLIAEEVAQVIPQLVSFDSDGNPYTVSYHELPTLLLNEIQKLNRRIRVLEAKLHKEEL